MNATDILQKPAIACSLLLAICLLLLPFPLGSAEASHQHARILFLSSYHQGDPWSDRIIAGLIRKVLQR